MGSSRNVSNLRAALPKRLQDCALNPDNNTGWENINKAVAEALQLFVRAEERESQTTVDRLHQGIMSNGLGVAGHQAVLAALRSGQADTLVILDDYPREDREELVRAAIQAKVDIETVKDSVLLAHYGGAGCLLRYRQIAAA